MSEGVQTSGDEPRFQWYALIRAGAPLQQGDLLNGFPIMYPPTSVLELGDKAPEAAAAPVPVRDFNVVVMTQSCDLADPQADMSVILCPRYSLREAKNVKGKSLDDKNGWNNLTKGLAIGAHLLDKCDIPSFTFDYQVVDLKRVFTVPFLIVSKFSEKQAQRVRLMPPYREHLAQSFARQFMRIGLPIDLPKEYPVRKSG